MEELINKIRKYIKLTDEEGRLVKRLFNIISLKKGENILEEGKVCKSLFFVSKGLLRHYINYDGKELTINISKSENLKTVSR